MENPPQQLSLSELLHKLSELGGSDLHVTTGTAPLVRVMARFAHSTISSAHIIRDQAVGLSVLTDAQKHRFEENLELDFSASESKAVTFPRQHFQSTRAVGAVFRAIHTRSNLLKSLVCGGRQRPVQQATRSDPGDRTDRFRQINNLAAVIDKINKERHEHILTIEDPIEFLHNIRAAS